MTVRKVFETDSKGNRFQRKKKLYFPRTLISKDGIFYTGFLDRIREYTKKKSFELNLIETEEFKYLNNVKPGNHIIDGITLREDQEDTVRSVLKSRRGLFIGVMRYGKSYVAASVLKAFENENALFLCERTSILSQFEEELKSFGFKSVGKLNKNNPKKHKISLCTMKTLLGLNLIDLSDHWNVIILDECHLACGLKPTKTKGKDGNYKIKDPMFIQIFGCLAAPIRIGLTGTLPQTEESQIALEGLIGPIIKKIDFQEGQDLGILTNVKLKLISIPKCKKITNLTRYQDIYKEGIVNYNLRNQKIVEISKGLNDVGKSCLIFVINTNELKDIDHGKNICDLAEIYGLNPMYVRGNTPDDERMKIKKDLHEKKVLCVVSSSVFREGLTFASLDAVILAYGGRSSTSIQQGLGRGLGQWKGKKECYVYDFIDIGKYLSEHFCERLNLYSDLNLIDLK